ncbi:AAA family ATPase [Candidatus Omnitrophota bacterium]
MIIGLTGSNASGKGEASLYITSKGFGCYSLSDILREESKKLNIEPSRENLIRLGNDLRRKNGPSFLARRVIQGLSESGNYIVDSIRNPAEIEELGKRNDFILIGIDAPVETRFERSLKRKRAGDPQTLQEFIEKERRENKNSSENQQLAKCLQMADVIIKNDSTIEALHRKIDETIKKKQKT